MTPAERFCARFGIRHPIVLAPMAGGPSTPALAAAVTNAGGLGSLGASYLGPDQIRAEIAEVRRLTAGPFGVNLFAPETDEPDRSRVAEIQALLAPYREELGIAPEPLVPDPSFADQLAAVVDGRPAVASITFGVPAPEVVRALRDAGALVVGTATHVAEARALAAAGVDAIVAQGAEAGGHRGTFIGRAEDALVGTMALVPQVVDAVDVPVIAAGGIMDGRGVVAALALGASAAQLGTAFLTSDEAGSDAVYRSELLRGRDTGTAITRAFSGRAARGLRNRFFDEWAAREPAPWPVMNALTRDIRAAARRLGRPELRSLWAGQGVGLVRSGPAAARVAALVEEMDVARRGLG
jgi:nitronate monooxygenase